MKKILILGSIFLFLSCRNEPLLYLNSAIDIMEKNSIKKESIDWDKLRKSSIEKIKGKESIKQTYPIIEDALKELGDNHSFLLTQSLKTKIDEINKNLPVVESKIIDNKIAYLKIPAFFGNDSLPHKFALLIQSKIEKLDKPEIKGWIIDLTENSGGNMWSMYLGLSPILGEGVSGYFLDSDKEYFEWSYTENAVYEGKNKILEIANSYLLKNTSYKIAVLIGKTTASSGEAIAVAFKGMPSTQFIGESTYEDRCKTPTN